MTVYVDSAMIPFRQVLMSHMVADTLAELHQMAQAIGMKREWFQPLSFPHYDVPVDRRRHAIQLGAVVVTRRELGALMRRLRSDEAFMRDWRAARDVGW